MLRKDEKIYIAGHRGMVGSAIHRKLSQLGFTNIVTRTRTEIDLLDQQAVRDFFAAERPAHVYLAAAKVGGILGNSTYPADFIYENLMIQGNVVRAAHDCGVRKLLFLGSSCIYPRDCAQPIREEYLLSGPLEISNMPYAVAKIAGVVMCKAFNQQYGTKFISVMPTNLYGPNDNFHPNNSHVLPALLGRFHEAKVRGDGTVTVWGTGNARREFMHVDDLADACVHLMEHYEGDEPVNIGTGEDMTIRELAETIGRAVGYVGNIEWDTSKPDGTPRKLLDVSRLHDLGWRHSISLEDGLRETYRWYVRELEHGRVRA